MESTQMSEETTITIPSRPLNPFHQMYRDVVDCLTEPRWFFRERYPRITFNYALAFGIIVNWVAAFLEWLTRLIRHETLLDSLLKIRSQLQQLPVWKNLPTDIWAQTPEKTSLFPAWLAEVFGVALSPFQTLIRFVVSGLILWIGASLLVPKALTQSQAAADPLNEVPVHEPSLRDFVNITNTIKLVALASVPSLIGAILGFLPFGMGGAISWVYSFVILVLAISIRFRVSYLRSFAIVVLPGIVGVVALSCIISVAAALIFGTIAALFQVH
jgi:hypothetical protein